MSAILTVIDSLLRLYLLVVLVRCVLSWFNPSPFNPIVRAIYTLTEPVLWRIRRQLPFTYTSGIDFSPIVVMIIIYLLRVFVQTI